MDPRYRVRLARLGEGARLNDIEQVAGTTFDGLGLTDDALDHNVPLDELELLIAAGMVWVAATMDDEPVGFVAVVLLDGRPHIEELDVHPDHQRRGLGRALVEAARAWARDRGEASVTLSTFRSVPWNGPYYRRLGFEVVPERQWTDAMHELRAAEARRGMRIDARVVMRASA